MRRSATALVAVAVGVVLTVTACGSSADPERAEPAAAALPTLPPAPVSSAPPSAAPRPDAGLTDLQRRAQEAAQAEARRKARAPRNPLAGRPWAVYRGPQEMAWEPYVRARGATKETLATIALRPKAKWMGDWIADDEIYAKTREYIEVAQAGNPQALVQLTMFRMVPWEHEACRRLPTPREQASYRRWTDNFARAIGSTHAVVVLQPDGPFATCVPGRSLVPSRLIAYSARRLGALPHTSVYLDGGAGDWPAEGQGGVAAAVDFLVPAGIEHVRGVALNSTHYSATEDEVRRGAAIVAELAARGIRGKKVVINTSSNGQPFPFGTYTGPDPDHAYACRSRTDTRTCVALGIPPTTAVGSPRWGLPADVARLARQHVDAYLWFGRPWLYRQNQPFLLDRALAIVRSSPHVG